MFLFLQPRHSNPPEQPRQSFQDLMISKVQISYPRYEGNESESRAISHTTHVWYIYLHFVRFLW